MTRTNFQKNSKSLYPTLQLRKRINTERRKNKVKILLKSSVVITKCKSYQHRHHGIVPSSREGHLKLNQFYLPFSPKEVFHKMFSPDNI
jgi:hypothetical protein